jgi:CheY-like chemotaxis protein
MSHLLIAYERESELALVEKLLVARGHTVFRATNGLEALDIARREPPDLVVSDVMLPRMDGVALCRKWKQDERLQSVPFVFHTLRYNDPKYERFANELGAELFLPRTVRQETVHKRSTICSRRRQRRRLLRAAPQRRT